MAWPWISLAGYGYVENRVASILNRSNNNSKKIFEAAPARYEPLLKSWFVTPQSFLASGFWCQGAFL
jgi:hypothetical protein